MDRPPRRPAPAPAGRPKAAVVARVAVTKEARPSAALTQAHVRRLLAPFRKRGPDGKLLYSRADRKRMYQLLLVTLIPPGRAAALRPELQTLAGELSVAAGTRRGQAPKETMASLQAYFRKNPPNPQLLADLNEVLASLVKELEAAARKAQGGPELEDPRAAAVAPPAPETIGARSGKSHEVPDLLKKAGVTFMKLGPQRPR